MRCLRSHYEINQADFSKNFRYQFRRLVPLVQVHLTLCSKAYGSAAKIIEFVRREEICTRIRWSTKQRSRTRRQPRRSRRPWVGNDGWIWIRKTTFKRPAWHNGKHVAGTRAGR